MKPFRNLENIFIQNETYGGCPYKTFTLHKRYQIWVIWLQQLISIHACALSIFFIPKCKNTETVVRDCVETEVMICYIFFPRIVFFLATWIIFLSIHITGNTIFPRSDGADCNDQSERRGDDHSTFKTLEKFQ